MFVTRRIFQILNFFVCTKVTLPLFIKNKDKSRMSSVCKPELQRNVANSKHFWRSILSTTQEAKVQVVIEYLLHILGNCIIVHVSLPELQLFLYFAKVYLTLLQQAAAVVCYKKGKISSVTRQGSPKSALASNFNFLPSYCCSIAVMYPWTA